MYPELGRQFHQQRSIEFLAQEWRVPIDEVAQLYEDERAALEIGARIARFPPIFAIRKVRAAPRKRATVRQPA
jgi:hypothetical protein